MHAPGVNLYEWIEWDKSQMLTPCEIGRWIVGPENRIVYRKIPDDALPSTPVAGCAEVHYPFHAPFPVDHIHVRFLFSVTNRMFTADSSVDMTAMIPLEGPRGSTPQTPLLLDDRDRPARILRALPHAAVPHRTPERREVNAARRLRQARTRQSGGFLGYPRHPDWTASKCPGPPVRNVPSRRGRAPGGGRTADSHTH